MHSCLLEVAVSHQSMVECDCSVHREPVEIAQSTNLRLLVLVVESPYQTQWQCGDHWTTTLRTERDASRQETKPSSSHSAGRHLLPSTTDHTQGTHRGGRKFKPGWVRVWTQWGPSLNARSEYIASKARERRRRLNHQGKDWRAQLTTACILRKVPSHPTHSKLYTIRERGNEKTRCNPNMVRMPLIIGTE